MSFAVSGTPQHDLAPKSLEARPLIFSVIIPVLNEEKLIGQCLSALVRQSLRADEFEVIVVDNGSTDRTIEIATEYRAALRLSVVHKANCNISAARNSAAAIAKGTFLAFLDADCLPSEEWLILALKRLRCGDGGVIGAFYTIPPESTWVARAWYGDLPATRQGSVSYIPSGTLFLARSVFSKLGGFDPSIQTSEDFEFCQRVKAAGYQVLGFAELSTLHLGTPQTIAAFYRKQRWHGTGVRSVFVRNMLDRDFAKTILHTLYVSFCLLLGVVAVPFSLITHNFLILILPPFFFMLGSLAMAVHAANQRKRWSIIIPLMLLYAAYGVARSLSLLGPSGQRDARAMEFSSPRGSRASSRQAVQGPVASSRDS
jgi:glycosyltransferase involved in cell wall biosynthesis